MANGVNDSLAVALATDARPGLHQHGFLWRDIGQTEIGALPPGPNGGQTAATSINKRGWITGGSLGAKNFQHAILWDGSTLHDLGSADGNWSYGYAINIDGVVAGATSVPNDEFHQHAAVFQNGTAKDLGTLGAYTATAFGINDRGRVVGSSLAGTSSQLHAFVYDLPNDTISDPSWLLTTATAINDRGQIAATASHNGGAFQAVLLTPR